MPEYMSVHVLPNDAQVQALQVATINDQTIPPPISKNIPAASAPRNRSWSSRALKAESNRGP